MFRRGVFVVWVWWIGWEKMVCGMTVFEGGIFAGFWGLFSRERTHSRVARMPTHAMTE